MNPNKIQNVTLKRLFFLEKRGITPNVSAMVSTGKNTTEFPIKHLAKTFYFVLSFSFKAKSKDLADFIKIH
ncbi:hypothetical protein ATE84_3645 [Aquimarina sp. MAR_2010_214]|nr:hypothetical protein ATE84_3645 [Aquimarina sp. MAR_2010_214]